MTWDHRRTEWQTAAEPVTGPRFVWSKLQRIVIHWNGSGLRWPYDTAQVLRSQQHAYLTQKNPPYSLGYNDAIDGAGESWEIRGEDIKCAANVEVNESSYAIQVIVYSPTGDTWSPANDAQIAAIRERVTAVRARALAEGNTRHIPIVAHADVATNSTHTACCGPAMRQQIADGVFEPVEQEQPNHPDPVDPAPTPKPDPIPGGDPMITVFKPKEGADLKGEVVAQFIGMADANGNVLGDLRWIATAEDIAVRDAHIAAGARVDDGDCTKGRFRNCDLRGAVPVGATYQWTADDFWHVVPD